MTSNSLRYQELQETKRHNAAMEGVETGKLDESRRHNTATESEAYRSNVARETETHRSALVNEGIQRDTLEEKKRSNLVTEGLQLMAHQEAKRHALITEAETHRSNVAKENETYRSNVARETETHRTNVANENIGYIHAQAAMSSAAAAHKNAAANAIHAQAAMTNAGTNQFKAVTERRAQEQKKTQEDRYYELDATSRSYSNQLTYNQAAKVGKEASYYDADFVYRNIGHLLGGVSNFITP